MPSCGRTRDRGRGLQHRKRQVSRRRFAARGRGESRPGRARLARGQGSARRAHRRRSRRAGAARRADRPNPCGRLRALLVRTRRRVSRDRGRRRDPDESRDSRCRGPGHGNSRAGPTTRRRGQRTPQGRLRRGGAPGLGRGPVGQPAAGPGRFDLPRLDRGAHAAWRALRAGHQRRATAARGPGTTVPRQTQPRRGRSTSGPQHRQPWQRPWKPRARSADWGRLALC